MSLSEVCVFDSLRGRCYTLPGLEKSQKHEARIIISPSSSLLGQAHGIADVKLVLAQGLVETNQSFFVNQDLTGLANPSGLTKR